MMGDGWTKKEEAERGGESYNFHKIFPPTPSLTARYLPVNRGSGFLRFLGRVVALGGVVGSPTLCPVGTIVFGTFRPHLTTVGFSSASLRITSRVSVTKQKV